MLTRNYWDAWLAHHAPRYPHEKLIQHVFRNFAASALTGLRALEIGSGNGRNCTFFHNEKMSTVGLDYSLGGGRASRTNVPGGHFVCGQAENLPFREGVFDLVAAIYLLEILHQEAQSLTVRETSRILKPGGRGLFIFTAQGDFREQAAKMPMQFFTEAETRTLFGGNLFTTVCIDQHITTFDNGASAHRDWLVGVVK